MNFAQTIILSSHVPILVTVVYAAARHNTLGPELKIFSWFVFLSGFVQFVSLAFWFAGKNNMPLLHFYVAAGFACLAWFYKTVLKGFIDAPIIWSVTILFLLFTLINSLFFQPFLTFNSNALTAEAVLVIILTLFTYIFFLNDIVRETGGKDIKSLTWINSGLFIYYSSTLLIFYFGATINQVFSKDLSQYTWIFHSFFSMVMYTFFCIGLWKRSEI
jgi:hypothetical protein